MTKETLKEIQDKHTKMVHNKKTGKDEATLCVTWDYMHDLHGFSASPVKKEKSQTKIDNEIVLAYHYKERHGKRVRNVPVSCPRRLLKTVQDLGMEEYGKDCVLPKIEKKEVIKDESKE